MDLITLLVAAHPPAWRRRYGAEFAALLEQTRLRPAVVLDVLANAARARVRARRRGLLLLGAVVVCVASVATAKLTGQAPNILWLPRSGASALLLLGTLGPWPVVIGLRRRRPALGA